MSRVSSRALPLLLFPILLFAAGLASCGGDVASSLDRDSISPFGQSGTSPAVASDPVDEKEATEVRENIEQNEATPIRLEASDIEKIIRRLHAEAELLGLHLDYDRDKLRYECLVRKGDRVIIIVIDPQTGKVEEEREAEDYYYTTTINVTQINVDVRYACNRAQSRAGGSIVEVNVEEIDGSATYVIVLITRDNRYVTIYIDARTGFERKIKRDKECKKKKDEKEVGKKKKCKHHAHGHKHKKGRGHYRHGKGHGYGHGYHCTCDCDCDNEEKEDDDD